MAANRRLAWPWLPLVALPLALLSAAAFLAGLPEPSVEAWPFRVGLGGIVGDFVLLYLAQHLPMGLYGRLTGATALLFGIAALGLRWRESSWAIGNEPLHPPHRQNARQGDRHDGQHRLQSRAMAMVGEPNCAHLMETCGKSDGETLSEGSTDRGERTVWQPNLAASGQGTVRAIGPTQDATAAAVYAELLEIGERSLGDRATAERLVSGLFRANGQLVAAASHAPESAQSEAAKSELARMVRRVALDALRPVTTAVPTTESLAARAQARKLRPVAKAAPNRAGRRISIVLLALVAGGVFLLSRELWPPSDQLADTPPPDPAATVADPAPDHIVAPTATPTRQEDALELDAATPRELVELEAEKPDSGPLEGPIGTAMSSRPAQTSTPQPEDTVSASVAADLRVFILYPDGAEPAAGELYAALSDSSEFPLVVLREVEFIIAAPRIRYFYPEDADSAYALADVLRPPSDHNNQWTVQDFTQFRPLPAPGTLEIFIPAV